MLKILDLKVRMRCAEPLSARARAHWSRSAGSASTPAHLTLFRLYRTVPFRVSSERRSVNIQPTCTTKETILSLFLNRVMNVFCPEKLKNTVLSERLLRASSFLLGESAPQLSYQATPELPEAAQGQLTTLWCCRVGEEGKRAKFTDWPGGKARPSTVPGAGPPGADTVNRTLEHREHAVQRRGWTRASTQRRRVPGAGLFL